MFKKRAGLTAAFIFFIVSVWASGAVMSVSSL